MSTNTNNVAGHTLESTLQIECKNELASLERLLRVVRFRGFSVVTFNAQLDSVRQLLNVDLTVAGERPLHLLENQLRKNYEVISVRVVASQSGQGHELFQGEKA